MVETKPGYLVDTVKGKLKKVNVDRLGNVVKGLTTIVDSDQCEFTLVDYDFRKPIAYPCEGLSTLDDEAGDTVYIQGQNERHLVANYDVRRPVKYPTVNSTLSDNSPSVSKN